MNVFYVLIRTTANYEFDKIRTAGVTGNATNYKNSQGDNAYVQSEMKSRSRPGQFYHEPPLLQTQNINRPVLTCNAGDLLAHPRTRQLKSHNSDASRS